MSDSDQPRDLIEAANDESAEARAHRLTEQLRGLLKEELAEYGGGEAFLRWVHPDHDEVC